jgi:hypothetical protein
MRMLLRATCALVLLGILVAGLWPFHAPLNQVSWLTKENGLLFGRHGSVVSASPLKAQAAPENNSCSLEIWLQPRRIDSAGAILAFYSPESRVVSFTLRQFRGGLELERKSPGNSVRKPEIYVGKVFSGLKSVLVTITSSEAGTATYVDGALLETVPDFVISNQDLTGQIVIGSAPRTNFNWSGRIKGLAIYDRKLSGFEVAQSFVDWAKGREVDPAKNDGIVASYLFDEGKGNVVHNQVDPATDLLIPKRFFVLDQQFLERPWNEFHPGWNYWKDVAINIVGFIPLGFFFYAYLYQVRKVEYAAALAVAFGFAVSLTIEVLQAFLPTRDSGMTDLITNTLGTAIGVMAFRHKAVQALVAVAAVRTAKESVSAVAG